MEEDYKLTGTIFVIQQANKNIAIAYITQIMQSIRCLRKQKLNDVKNYRIWHILDDAEAA